MDWINGLTIKDHEYIEEHGSQKIRFDFANNESIVISSVDGSMIMMLREGALPDGK